MLAKQRANAYGHNLSWMAVVMVTVNSAWEHLIKSGYF